MPKEQASIPLKPQYEHFAIAICDGQKLQAAYKLAGFTGQTHAAAWQTRNRPDVDARIKWMLKERVEASTRAFTRRKKSNSDLLERVVNELKDIAFHDIREVVDWRRETVTNADGEVIGIEEVVDIRDSKGMPAEAAKAIKGVFMKSGKLRVEMYDKRASLETLAKLLSGNDIAQPANVTVNQVNLGNMDALEAARRVSFLLAAVQTKQPQPAPSPLIEGKADPIS